MSTADMASTMEVQLPTAEAPYHNRYDLRRHRSRGPPPQHSPIHQHGPYGNGVPAPASRKRKAGPHENERLSKRLGLLNLERDGHRLYIPCEESTSQPIPENPGCSSNHLTSTQPPPSTPTAAVAGTDECMQLDDTKYKVYIHDLDAELSSADETSDYDSQPGSPTSGSGRLVFLPDIEKHLKRTRIPPAVFANSEGELGGHNINDMQMVLYRTPSSLTVPREHDSVRKAILEARARARQKQTGEGETAITPPSLMVDSGNSGFSHNYNNNNSIYNNNDNNTNQPMNGFGSSDFTPTSLHQNATPWRESLDVDDEYDDVDAMDMD